MVLQYVRVTRVGVSQFALVRLQEKKKLKKDKKRRLQAKAARQAKRAAEANSRERPRLQGEEVAEPSEEELQKQEQREPEADKQAAGA